MPDAKVLLVFSKTYSLLVKVPSRDVQVRSLKMHFPDEMDANTAFFIHKHPTEDLESTKTRKQEDEDATISSIVPEGGIEFYVGSLSTGLAPTLPITTYAAAKRVSKMPLAEAFKHLEFVTDRTHSSTKRRASIFDSHDGAIVDGDVDYCDSFPFVNRETESKALLEAFCNMEKMRGLKRYDAKKRKVAFPVCAGLPGIGKSRFARIAGANLVGDVAPGERLAKLKGIVNDLRCLPVDRVESFCDGLLNAYDGRNLRIAGDELVKCATISTESAAAIELVLHAWRHTYPEGNKLDLREQLKDIMQNTYSLRDVIDFITGGCPTERVVIINIDEAHHLKGLVDLLNAFAALIIDGYKVYVTVTGVKPEIIQNGFDLSQVKTTTIHLPLLQSEHVATILQSLFGIEKLSLSLSTVVSWLGGVPRYLQYFLECAATKFRCETHEQLGKAIAGNSACDLMDVVHTVCRAIKLADYPPEFYENVLAFAVAEISLDRSTDLYPKRPREFRTASWAEAQGILYLQPSVSTPGLSVVRVPPLVLFYLQTVYATSKTLARVPCLDAQVYMSAGDSEAFTLSVLLLKLRACHILGEKRVSMKSLCAAFPDVSVKVPRVHTYDVLESKVEDKECLRGIINQRRASDYDGPVGFINGRGASACDAYLVLDKRVVAIQEKQRVRARQDVIGDNDITIRATGKAITEEEEKVCTGRFKTCFVYVSDGKVPDGATAESEHVLLGGRDAIADSLGRFVADMRVHHWEDCGVRAGAVSS